MPVAFACPAGAVRLSAIAMVAVFAATQAQALGGQHAVDPCSGSTDVVVAGAACVGRTGQGRNGVCAVAGGLQQW